MAMENDRDAVSPQTAKQFVTSRVGLVLGIISIVFGCVMGFFLLGLTLLGQRVELPSEAGLPRLAAHWFPGMATLFAMLNVPAGIGIILHRKWSRSLAQAAAVGLFLSLGIWALLIIVRTDFFGVGLALFLFLATLPWIVILRIALNRPSVKQLFDDR